MFLACAGIPSTPGLGGRAVAPERLRVRFGCHTSTQPPHFEPSRHKSKAGDIRQRRTPAPGIADRSHAGRPRGVRIVCRRTASAAHWPEAGRDTDRRNQPPRRHTDHKGDTSTEAATRAPVARNTSADPQISNRDARRRRTGRIRAMLGRSTYDEKEKKWFFRREPFLWGTLCTIISPKVNDFSLAFGVHLR
jgi:hypothetical protein